MVQQWVVPGGVTQLTVDAAGGQGGAGTLPGGNGARLIASFSVIPGETLNVVVGGMGGGGGFVGGGGGGSFVYDTATAAGLLLAAAGGGGSCFGLTGAGTVGSATTTASSGAGSIGGIGGAAGTGGNGGGGGSGSPAPGGGGGGLLTDGGDGIGTTTTASGGKALANGAAGGATGFSAGGFGGGGAGSIEVTETSGGGGGGGYNGGGGGATGASTTPAGGGGGGSFVNASGTTLFAQSGMQSGDGQVTFCYSPIPDLAIQKSHTGTFARGDVGRQFTITVSNVGSAATTGTVTVTDSLPAGLTATGFGGSGWLSCTATPVVGPGTLSCQRSDSLAMGNSYPPILLTVNVAGDAPPSMTNRVQAAGGGETNLANDTASDPVTIQAPGIPALSFAGLALLVLAIGALGILRLRL